MTNRFYKNTWQSACNINFVKKQSEHFCQAMTLYFGANGKPLANLVMSISSYTPAKSVVEYSESPVNHYQFSSIGKLFARLLLSVGKDTSKFEKQVQSFIKAYIPFEAIIRTQLDSFPVYKPLSSTHPERSAVYLPNVQVAGQKPVEIGYNISSLNQGFASKWSIPHSMQRTPIDKTYQQIGIKQLQEFISTLPANSPLVVNTSDSSYGNAEFLATLYEYEHLVNIIRLKNRNVYEYAPKTNLRGAKGIYGQVYNLRKINQPSHRKNPKTKELCQDKPSIQTKIPDQTSSYLTQTHKGRAIKVELKLYQNMMIRSKNKHNMKDKQFDLLIVEHLDACTLEPIHQKPIYLAICGKQKDSIPLTDAYQTHYAHRFDIEPNNRFLKHQLGLDKFQTPIQQHFDLWLSIIQLAEWLLLLASQEVEHQPKKWQKYAIENQAKDITRLSITQTRKSCQPFF